MIPATVGFDHLRSLLRRRADDPHVVELIGGDPSLIERYAYQGFVEFRDRGISLMFKEAPHVSGSIGMTDPATLHVSAIHLHQAEHEGYSEYSGGLPRGVAFGDSEEVVRRKLGEPSATGGGGVSSVLKKPIPRWLRYSTGDAILQLQLDTSNRVEMASLYVPDVLPRG